MTTTWGLSYLYGSISRILLTATRSYAICPQLKSVLAAVRASSGGMTFSGQSSTMAFQPLEIAEDGTHFYAIGTTGVEKHTMAAVPVFANLFSFDAGLGKFIFSQGSYLVVPDGDSGVQTISRTTGLVQDSLPGVLSKIHAGCYDSTNRRLWLFDQDRAKGVSIQVGTAGQLTYSATFPIPNCRDIVRVVFDAAASLLFVINDHRIVSFSTVDWEAPELSVDYGVNTGTFTDFAKIGTNQYWIGMAEPSNADAVPGPFGAQYGAWDSVNAEMQIACPKMSLWTVSNAIPYWTITTIPEVVITPPPVVPPVAPPVIPPYIPPVVVPPAPVITSSLTASLTEDTAFSYTITATGVGPIYYDVGTTPSWFISINHITGAITGLPPDPGTFNLVITATGPGGTDTETLVVTVTAAIGNNTGVRVLGDIEGAHVDGTLIYIVGTFTSVTDSSGTVTRNRAACLNASTGLWTAWNPNLSATGYCVHKNLSHVYIGTRTAAPTIGGVAVSYMGRVDPTTGAVDATWTPTFNGQINCIRGDADLYVAGGFTLVNGNVRSCICSFSGGSLTGWDVRTADTPANRILNHISAPIGSMNMVQPFNGVVGFMAGSLRADKNGAGNSDWCGSWGVADASTGLIVQSVHGFNATGLSGQTPESLQPTGFTYLYGTDMAGVGPTLLPATPGVEDTTVDVYSVVTMSSAGTITARARLPFTGGGATGLLDKGSYMLVAGDYPTVTGYPTQKFIVKYNPSSGVVDTGFNYYNRLNAYAQGVSNSIRGVRGLPGDACVVYGSIGDATAFPLHDGVRYQGILILNTLTGARL